MRDRNDIPNPEPHNEERPELSDLTTGDVERLDTLSDINSGDVKLGPEEDISLEQLGRDVESRRREYMALVSSLPGHLDSAAESRLFTSGEVMTNLDHRVYNQLLGRVEEVLRHIQMAHLEYLNAV